ncbi:MAG: nucleoside hydrolase [Clostridia bacterium]|nr:nucleoside hydrolase [Clostridia bacterium]
MKYQFTVPDAKHVRVIVSTDAACEADDPFAIVHALLSPKMDVKAIVAEHFAQPGSMEKSLAAARRVTSLMGSSVPVLCGQAWPRDDAVSEGASCIVDEARREDDRPLFLLCMGAMTTAAAALAAAPDIAGRMTIVTIGGRAYGPGAWTFREFNWGNDHEAVNAILQSDVPLWQIPISGYGMMRVGLAELQHRVARCGEIGAYLLRQMDEYNNSDCAGWTAGESWSLGDNPAVGVVLHPGCGENHMQPAWLIDEETAYVKRLPLRRILVYQTIDSRYVLEDLFAKLAIHFGPEASDDLMK